MKHVRCHTCGAELVGPEMSAQTLAHYLALIQDTKTVPALHALAHEIASAFPRDEATPRLMDVIAAKVQRPVAANSHAP